jgi:hypothetical protein
MVIGERRVSRPDRYEHLKTCEIEMYDESEKISLAMYMYMQKCMLLLSNS